MPELFLELFSEEIPARMQARAAEDLARLAGEALAPLTPRSIQTFHGPRRIALAAEVAAGVEGRSSAERGPRVGAPEQALAGFLRKHGASRDQLRVEGDRWVLERASEAVSAAALIAAALPPLLRRFPWPKSMRWGGTSTFTWVRPLRRIICLLDDEVVRFDLREGRGDDGHGLVSGDLTEGHRFLSPGAVAVSSCWDWQEKLLDRHVLVDAGERKRVIVQGVAALIPAAPSSSDMVGETQSMLTLVEDPGLLDEVAGLVEWPVPLLGRIDAAYMDLPPEVMQVSMRVHLRYFALRTASGDAAPWFAFVANIEALDGGAAIIAGNERVLRARFADARYFWDLDRRTPLAARVPALDGITFHAKLGSQGQRVRRIETLARTIAPLVGADPALAERAAFLAKADLLTGMVGEFPELQGVIGRYYALHDGEPLEIADAIRDHYAPKGPSDAVPSAPVSIAVALADKLDQLAGFFAVGERPSGSGDPYALRRAALGLIRIIRETGQRVSVLRLADDAFRLVDESVSSATSRRQDAAGRMIEGTDRDADQRAFELLEFLAERLRVQLRADGARHDVLSAVFAAGADDDINRLLARAEAVTGLLGTDDGANLLVAYRRAANILRIENRKDGPHLGEGNPAAFREEQERELAGAVGRLSQELPAMLRAEEYAGAMSAMSRLRPPLDAFFDNVTVNADEPELRRNRLRLLFSVRSTMDRVADFSRIEG